MFYIVMSLILIMQEMLNPILRFFYYLPIPSTIIASEI